MSSSEVAQTCLTLAVVISGGWFGWGLCIRYLMNVCDSAQHLKSDLRNFYIFTCAMPAACLALLVVFGAALALMLCFCPDYIHFS